MISCDPRMMIESTQKENKSKWCCKERELLHHDLLWERIAERLSDFSYHKSQNNHSIKRCVARRRRPDEQE